MNKIFHDNSLDSSLTVVRPGEGRRIERRASKCVRSGFEVGDNFILVNGADIKPSRDRNAFQNEQRITALLTRQRLGDTAGSSRKPAQHVNVRTLSKEYPRGGSSNRSFPTKSI